MTDKKDTIIAQYDVAFLSAKRGKRTQWYLYEDLTDDYRKKNIYNGYSFRDTDANTTYRFLLFCHSPMD